MARRVLVAIAIGAVAAVAVAAALPLLDERPQRLPDGAKATRIVVEKSSHRMILYLDDHEPRAYRVALGRGGMMRKQREGDKLVPEGTYSINDKPSRSQFYRALHISYPSAADTAAGRTGSDIEIHGLPNGLGWLGSWHRVWDWTAGCIAVTNSEMDEVWRVVDRDTPIEIRP